MSSYHIKSLQEYLQQYKRSIQEPENFWAEIAEENFLWSKKWTNVLSWDFSKPTIQWFEGAKLNITQNCLDRHLLTRSQKTAILFEPNNPQEPPLSITYQDLHQRVCKLANVLKKQGVKKGDRVCIYLPMIPELAVSLLACARIGAVHSVVFAGFSASALQVRIEDCNAKLVITADGGYRGNKTIELKKIVDTAIEKSTCVKNVLVVNHAHTEVSMKTGRDLWLEPLLTSSSIDCAPEMMDAEDPLFILYTSGSTGKPKGMLHTVAGYMVYTAYTFKNVFNYQEEDIYWCTADIGWITGHSYIVYGPLANGATTLMFEGIPSYPDHDRFWEIIEKHKVNQFYTAPTALRALAKENIAHVTRHDLSSIKVLGTVGEPINEEAWLWYHTHVGGKTSPIVDTWWQTETGGCMISPIPFITPLKPTYATWPLPGIQPILVDDEGKEITKNHIQGKLCIRFPWPGMARSIWNDHKRYQETYFSAFKNLYFSGDGAIRDEVGYYRIIGRVDDIIIVSGHNLGTAPIEDAINEHPEVAESALVGYPHDIKGNALYGFVILKKPELASEDLKKEINQKIADHIGPIAKLDKIQFVPGLPKTRSGKIMRRILRKVASGETDSLGDTSTLLNPDVVEAIVKESL